MEERKELQITEIIPTNKKKWQFWLPKTIKRNVLTYYNCDIIELNPQDVTAKIKST